MPDAETLARALGFLRQLELPKLYGVSRAWHATLGAAIPALWGEVTLGRTCRVRMAALNNDE